MESSNLDCELRYALDIKNKLLQIKDILSSGEAYPLQIKLQLKLRSIILQDLEFAFKHKVEQELWNYGIKHYITPLQNAVKDKKNPKRKQKQFELGYCLNAANGFYIILLEEFIEEYNLNLNFIRRIPSLLPEKKVNSTRTKIPSQRSCKYFCHLILIRMGDLARYRNQPLEAEMHYKHAVELCSESGQPFNQLALLTANRQDSFHSIYNYIRSISAPIRFPAAISNLEKSFKSTLATFPNDPETRCLTTKEFRANFIKAHALMYFRKDLPRASKLLHLLSFYVGRHMHKSKNKLKNDEILQMVIITLYTLGRTSLYLEALPEPKISEREIYIHSTSNEYEDENFLDSEGLCKKHSLEFRQTNMHDKETNDLQNKKITSENVSKNTDIPLKTILKPPNLRRQLSDLTISSKTKTTKSTVTFSPRILKKTSSYEDLVNKVKKEYPVTNKPILSNTINAIEVISQGSMQMNTEESIDNLLSLKKSNESIENTHSRMNKPNSISRVSLELTEEDQKIKSDALNFLASLLAACLCRVHSKQPVETLFTYAELAPAKLILEWIREHPRVLCDPAFIKRPALWPALSNLLNKFQYFIQKTQDKPDIYNSFPLPEDRMLLGCIPFEKAFSKLKFELCTHLVRKETWQLIRAMRILELGIWLAEVAPYKVLIRRCVTPTIENPCGVLFEPIMTIKDILKKGKFVRIDQLPGLLAKGAQIDSSLKEYIPLKLKSVLSRKQAETPSLTPTPTSTPSTTTIIQKPIPIRITKKLPSAEELKSSIDFKNSIPITSSTGAIRKNYSKNKKDGYHRSNNNFNSFNKIRSNFNHSNHHIQNNHHHHHPPHHHHHHHHHHQKNYSSSEHNHQSRQHNNYIRPTNNNKMHQHHHNHQPRYPIRNQTSRDTNFSKSEEKIDKPDVSPLLILTHSPRLEIKRHFHKIAKSFNIDKEKQLNPILEDTNPKIILTSRKASESDESQSKTEIENVEQIKEEKENQPQENQMNTIKINNTNQMINPINQVTNVGEFLKHPTTLVKHDIKKTIRKTQMYNVQEKQETNTQVKSPLEEKKLEVMPEVKSPEFSSSCVSWWTQDSAEWSAGLSKGPPMASYSLFNDTTVHQQKNDLGPSFNSTGFSSQSLWSGPGPSPLERLLQQQRQQREAGT